MGTWSRDSIRVLLTVGLVCLIAQMPTSQSQPLPPVTCDVGHTSCTVSSVYRVWPDRSICKAAKVYYPTNEEEILAAVAEAVQNGQKMRVVSAGSHSIPKLVCPGGDGTGVLISTRDLTQNIVVDKVKQTATVDAGVHIKVFFDYIAQSDLAFPHSPYWDGLSISGVLGTGAHGSSAWGKGSSIYDYVVGMRLVVPASAGEGYAKIVTLVDGDEDLNAAKVSLGVLGVISTVTLQLEPMFKRQITNDVTSDAEIETQIAAIASAYEFGDVSWYPSLETAVYRKDNRVDVKTHGVGTNNFTGFVPQSILVVEAARILEETAEFERDAGAKCLEASLQVGLLALEGNGWTNDGSRFTGYPIVGYQNSIQTSGTCQDASYAQGYVCAWDHRHKGEFFHQTAFTVSFDLILDFVKDVKALVKNDKFSLCGLGLYSGIIMRFVKKSSGAYLGEISDGVNMDITYYRASNASTPRLNEDALEEIEQMLMYKYAAKPHWGKNRPVAFKTASSLFPDLPKFLDVKNRYDPDGLFSNEWTDAVLNVGGAGANLEKFQPYCALEGLCICSEDIHCAPQAGYFCRPGIVFPDARVCRYGYVEECHFNFDYLNVH